MTQNRIQEEAERQHPNDPSLPNEDRNINKLCRLVFMEAATFGLSLANEWYTVGKDFPEVGQYVLCCNENNHRYVTRYETGIELLGAVYWFPLPIPPKK